MSDFRCQLAISNNLKSQKYWKTSRRTRFTLEAKKNPRTGRLKFQNVLENKAILQQANIFVFTVRENVCD